jgi:hypothetical protein
MRLQVEPTQLGRIDKSSLFLRTPAATPERFMNRIQSSKRRVLIKIRDDG